MKMSSLFRSRMSRLAPRRHRLDVESLEGREVPAYAVIGLGALSAADVNAAGMVVGTDYTVGRATLWNQGALTDLGTLGGDTSYAAGISNAGHVVGSATTADGYQHAFLLTPSDVDSDGDLDWFADANADGANDLMRDLGAPPDGWSHANAVNEAGQAVGSYWDPADGLTHAALWTGGVTTDLGALPGYNSSNALAVDSSGAAAGYSWTQGYDPAFLWTPDAPNGTTGTLAPLAQYVGENSQAYAMNDAGQVVGAADAGNGYQQAVVWEGGSVAGLGFVAGYEASSSANDVNEAGQAVGWSAYEAWATEWYYDEWTGEYYQYSYPYLVTHAALWQNGAAVDLNDAIAPGSGWSLDSAVAVSDAGHVVGHGYGPDGSNFLLVPDTGDPMVLVGDASASEGDAGGTVMNFTVTRIGSTDGSFTVEYATAGGTATAGVDYAATSGTLTFGPGETSKTVPVTVYGNSRYELDETVFLNLSNAVDAAVIDREGAGTILNDDAAPVLGINDATVAEGNSGTVDAVFTISLAGDTDVPVVVNYSTYDGSASGWSDYASQYGRVVTFAPGETSKTVSVAVNGDAMHEADETFVLAIAADHATLADDFGLGTILNDDPVPQITVQDARVVEGDQGHRTMVFRVYLSSPSGTSVAVNYSTANGTASSNGKGNSADYRAASGTLWIGAGQTYGEITVLVNGDRRKESNETFVLNLSGATNATIADAQGVGTIDNDD